MTSFNISQALTALAVGVLGITSSAKAADFSFRGNFPADDTVQFFNFTVNTDSNVTLKSLSYAGGTQADGTVISAGGFDPILSVFDSSTGNQIAQNDDGNSSNVGTDPVTGQTYDTFLRTFVNPGQYTVAVSQFSNFAGDTLSDPFPNAGQRNFTATLTDPGCSAGQFCDVSGDSRTNFWAFDILNVNLATAPKPVALSSL
jgi:hypothetical protein